MKRQICMLKWCGSGGVVKSDYSVSSLSEKESRERESLTIKELNHKVTYETRFSNANNLILKRPFI